jgi:hypothetical protein
MTLCIPVNCWNCVYHKRYAECHDIVIRFTVVLVNVVILSVVILSVVILSVVTLSVFLLKVTASLKLHLSPSSNICK